MTLRGGRLGVHGRVRLSGLQFDPVVVEGRPDMFRGGDGGEDMALRRRRRRGAHADTSACPSTYFPRGASCILRNQAARRGWLVLYASLCCQFIQSQAFQQGGRRRQFFVRIQTLHAIRTRHEALDYAY